MAGKIVRMDSFDNALESWDAYQERLEQYFLCNDIANSKKVPVLLTFIGGNTYSLGLTAPEKPASYSYAALVKLLRDHLSPRPLVIAERFRFHKREQKEGESVRDYIANLRKLSEFCNFGATLNGSLRDRFVCGLSNENIQKKLLSEVDLTYDSAVDIATAMETASKDATELQAKHGSSSINQMSKGNYYKKVSRNSHKRETQKQAKKCYRCKRTGHDPSECYFKDQECYKCRKVGHSKTACQSKGSNNRSLHAIERSDDSDSDTFLNSLEIVPGVADVNSVSSSGSVIVVKPTVNGVDLEMELDIGAAVSVIPHGIFKQKFPNVKMKTSDLMLKTCSGEKIRPVGMATVDVSYNGQEEKLTLYVVSSGKVTLFGRAWMKHIKLDWPEIKLVSHVNKVDLKSVLDKYKNVFKDDWGKVNKIKAKLKLKPGSQPKFVKARQVPYALKPKVETELDRLVKDGILEKCDHSDLATPVVPVVKKDGSVRLCGDFKVTVNQCLDVDQYPLPRIEDIFAALSGGKYFSKIDLKHAYLQMEVDEESRELLTINTEKGLNRFNRMVYGIASAPAIWQRTMDTILQGLPGVKCIIDDMIITGKNDQKHIQNLSAVLERLDQYGLRANLDKCKFFQEKITFCGHEIDEKGLHKIQSKIDAVVQAPKPENVSELRSFLGLVNYYSRFLPNLSTELHPLYQLLEKEHGWKWSSECNDAFKRIKQLITSSTVLTHYDPTLPLYLATDASPFGIGAVLSHLMPDGNERPVAYASRSLSSADKNYSQIDKEASAITWAHLFGRHFKLITDHQPLISIFSPQKGISSTSAARLQRQALFLSGYDYEIVYKNTKKHGNADGLSRLPMRNTTRFEDETEDETAS